jgi:hypothetical protein
LGDTTARATRSESWPSICIGIPSYNEGASIVPTLDSIEREARACGLVRPQLILSDSSRRTETVDAVTAWAATRDLELVVDRSEERRIGKIARNVLFEHAQAEIFVGVDADVVLPPGTLAHLVDDLLAVPGTMAVVGIAAPDPAFRCRGRRASWWQLAAAARASRWAPPEEMRAQTALWACRRAFYERFRFVPTSGKTDDTELLRRVQAERIPVRGSTATVLKVPPAGLADFFLQTERGWVAAPSRRRMFRDLRAAGVGAVTDPVGFGAYLVARGYCVYRRRRSAPLDIEQWPISYTTKRGAAEP